MYFAQTGAGAVEAVSSGFDGGVDGPAQGPSDP
jgi:hypothetical protein